MKNQINYSSIIEAIFAVVIGQNALMLSQPVIAFLAKKISFIIFLVFMLIGIINTLTLIANWQQSKETENRYNKSLFIWDIITLAEFAFLTQILYGSFEGLKLLISERSILIIYSINYIMIYFSFVFWNQVSIHNSAEEEFQYIKKAIKINYIVIITLLVMLIATFTSLEIIWYISFFFSAFIQIIALFFYYYNNMRGEH